MANAKLVGTNYTPSDLVAKVTGKSLRVNYSLDPALMGGAVVKVGSTIYDGSVRGQLQRMREQLANG